MNIKYRQVLQSVDTVNQLQLEKLPPRGALVLSRNVEYLAKEEKIIREALNNLFNEHKVDDKIPEDKTEEFEESVNKLLDTEIDLPLIMFRLDDFGKLEFSSAELGPIGYMIDLE